MTIAGAICEITAIIGSMPPDELAVRKRIRTARSVASFRAHKAEGPNSRSLLWMAAECANHFMFAPWPVDSLEEVAEFCCLLLDAAERAARLEMPDELAAKAGEAA